MDLTTRCPQCGTVFQATLSDLQLRKGYIRCVQCAHIFDGYAEVVSETAGGTPQPLPPAVPPAPPPPPAVAPAQVRQDALPPDPQTLAPQVIRPGRPAAARPATAPAAPAFHIGVPPWPDDRPDERPEPRLGVSLPDGPRPVEEILADEGWVPDAASRREPGLPDRPVQAESFMVEARPGHRSQGGSAAPLLQDEDALGWWDGVLRIGGRLLLALLLLLLAAQAVYVYRASVARLVPALRPALEQACVRLHCTVPYARDRNQIAITGSALKAADANAAMPQSTADPEAQDQRFVLHATLRNLAEQPQEWPTLVLDLKDAAGTLLVRRNLPPAEYVGPARAAEPFGAREEILVRVPLTVSGVRVNGYQLDLFYP